METIPENVMDFLREQYPEGTRIQIRELSGEGREPAPEGIGTLERVDETGAFHVRWPDGSELALKLGEDKFDVLAPELITLKLYMPMSAEIVDMDCSGFARDYNDEDLEAEGGCPELPLDSQDLVQYQDVIAGALEDYKMPEEAERGLMRWYHENDSVNRNVVSAEFKAEVRKGQLWCVTECKVKIPLTHDETDILKDYITGQGADGWGEGFEQRKIRVEDGDMYVHLWSSEKSWSIQTEQERFGSEPDRQVPQTAERKEPDKPPKQPAR